MRAHNNSNGNNIKNFFPFNFFIKKFIKKVLKIIFSIKNDEKMYNYCDAV